jgi:hypothetical protein
VDNLPAQQSPFDEPNQEIDLRRAWKTISRSAWIIVVCTGLAVTAAVVAARRIVPQYGAAATVRIVDTPRAGRAAGADVLRRREPESASRWRRRSSRAAPLAAEVVDSPRPAPLTRCSRRACGAQHACRARGPNTDAPSVSYLVSAASWA